MPVHCGDQRHLGLCLGRRSCTSRMWAQGRSQGTTLSASYLHNAQATIHDPFYNMEYKTIKKIWQNKSGHSINKSYSQWVQCTRPNHCLRQQWRDNSSQFHDVTNKYYTNIKNIATSGREGDRDRFEIYELALEHDYISSCTLEKQYAANRVIIRSYITQCCVECNWPSISKWDNVWLNRHWSWAWTMNYLFMP